VRGRLIAATDPSASMTTPAPPPLPDATPADETAAAQQRRAVAAIVAATVAVLPFGTIYAYSVFLAPMEAMLGIGRADMAFVFSLAAIMLTLGMVGTPRLYRRFSPATLLFASGALSAAGLGVAAAADTLAQLALGYGVLFGLGGGVVWTTLQQGMNQAVVSRTGLANGYFVSLYPLGAMIGAPLLGWAIAAHGLRSTLAVLAVTVLAATTLAAWLYRVYGLRMRDAAAPAADDAERRWDVFARLFGVFFLAAAAGLTMIGCGYGIVSGMTAGAIAQYWHRNAFGRVAGQIYIAWCFAAITLPMVAGWLFDRSQGYHGAMMLAAAVNLLGATLSMSLPRRAVQGGARTAVG
jgi:MFS family permease